MHPLTEEQAILTTEQARSNPTADDGVRVTQASSVSFVANPASIASALGVVRVVVPRVGFLFSVRDDLCTVTSHDGHREARSSFSVTEAVGSGDFVYPADFADEFAHVTSPVRLEANRDGQAFVVGYKFGAAASVTHASMDPRGVPSTRRADEAPGSAVEVRILAEGIKAAKPFVALPDDPLAAGHFKAVHVFRDGTLFASDGKVACYFRTDGLVGREFDVAAPQLPLLEKFVRRSSGTLSVQTTPARVTVTNDNGDSFAWPRSTDALTTYPSFKKDDDVVALVDPAEAMATLRHLQCALDRRERKVRIHFDRARGFWLSSSVATSDPILADFQEFRPGDALVGRVDIDHLGKLFSATGGDTVEFRVTVLPPGGARKEPAFFFRTVDRIAITTERGSRGGDATASIMRYAPGVDR